MTGIPVLAAPAIDPGSARIEMTLPEGLTLDAIVAAALPGASAADLDHARVTLVTPRGAAPIPRHHWHAVRPRPGVQVVIRLVPGRGLLRSLLSIVVSIAAVALGAMFGPGLGAMLGMTGAAATSVGTALVGLGVTMIGQLLINALIPPVKPDTERRNTYSISGWQNRMDPGGAVPVPLGQIRYAPPFAARTWTEIVGDWQYLHAGFVVGEGPVEISDLRIGETPITDYDEVEVEIRQGLPDDAPLSLMPRQILEEAIGAELTRPLPRDDLGVVIPGAPAEESPVVRTTGGDASAVSVILAFPSGLVHFDSKGRKRSHTVRIRIDQRLVTEESWTAVETLTITAAKAEAFYRQHGWTFPTRGRWQIRLTMLTDETESTSTSQRVAWAALQTIRPEYILAYPRPLALIALRIKATHQLNGSLDNISAMVRRVCPDWDAVSGTWITRATSNPASLYRYVLQSPSNPKRVPDEEIDLALLADWHEWCEARRLTYDRVLEESGTALRDVLAEIAAAGRATPRHDGRRWGVVIDRPSDLIVDHISPRNSWGFKLRRAYTELPHALIVPFRDAGNDFKPAERVVHRPGYVGEITLTEELQLPGLTDPETVWREGYRRFLETIHRPDTMEVTQEGLLRVLTRGDTAALSQDVLRHTERAARVRSVTARLIELDDVVKMNAGETYAIRFRVFEPRESWEAPDTIGTSHVRIVTGAPGETDILTVTGAGPMPARGEVVHFGPAASIDRLVMISGIERTTDECAILRAVAAAPEIDAMVAVAVPPPWSSRVGAELETDTTPPGAPRFAAIVSGLDAGAEGRIAFQIVPASGGIPAASYEVNHRPAAGGAWTSVILPAASGGGEIDGYAQGDHVQLRARAASDAGVVSTWSATIAVEIGAGDVPLPVALEEDAVTITPLLGALLIQFATGDDSAIAQVQIYRSTSATLDRDTDAAGPPLAVAALQSYSTALGDTTRAQLLVNGGFDTGTGWTAGTGWTVAGGVAVSAPGSAGLLSQAISLTAGRAYRLAYRITGRTDGALTPQLGGGGTVSGTAQTGNAAHHDRLVAAAGNTTLRFSASADFDGALDDAVLYVETAACLAQGTHYIWIEPQNSDGIPGPLTGPIPIMIV